MSPPSGRIGSGWRSTPPPTLLVLLNQIVENNVRKLRRSLRDVNRLDDQWAETSA